MGILGLSYKPNTEVIEESQGVGLAKHLSEAGVRVVVFDPLAMENGKRVLPFDTVFATSLVECAGQSDVLAITTPWPEFRALTAVDLKQSDEKPLILDCWRVFPARRLRSGRRAHPPGLRRSLGSGPGGTDRRLVGLWGRLQPAADFSPPSGGHSLRLRKAD